MAQLSNDSKSDRLKEGMKIKNVVKHSRIIDDKRLSEVDISKGNYMVVDENNKIESGLKGISKEEAERIKNNIVERRSKKSEQIYNREFGRSKNLKVIKIDDGVSDEIYDEKGSSMDYFLGADPRKHKDYKHFCGK